MNFRLHRKTFTLLTSRYYSSATVLDPPHHLLHLIQLSIVHQSLKLIRQSHARVFTHGFDQNTFFATKLISAYAICGNPTHSRLVFDAVKLKNVYLWNTMISGYAKNEAKKEAFELFKEMCHGNVLPDDYTLATVAKVSSEVGDLVAGKLIHGKCIRFGFVCDTVVSNSIMSMYCKCANFDECRKLFDEMPWRNVSSWNVLITGYVDCRNHKFDKEVWEIIKCMQSDGLKPDGFTISSVWPLCGGDFGNLNHGRELHCYIVKNELNLNLQRDVHLGCSLIDMYMKNSRVSVGRRVFDQMKCRNIYTWTAIINGYVQNGESDEALVLFRKMQVEDGTEPERVTLISVLPACNSHASLMTGKQIHGFAVRKVLYHDVSLCNALINMYSKCGSLDLARRVFGDGSFIKDAISWSSMISGYGLHGRGEEAVSLYDKMVLLGIKPDMLTIVGILSACGRSGLVNEGLKIFSSAVGEYEIEPTVEICACVVDMLGRSGQLDQALHFIKRMPVEPGPSVWGALVSASVMHGNSEMQDLAYRVLIQLEPESPSNFISLSNLYASSKQWDVVAKLRMMMKERGLRKEPGCSWICINSTTHCFYVADKAHPCSNSIYEMLDCLILAMKVPSHSPDSETPIQTTWC
ncbi:hypothetical protein FEM48_Zijuj07G0084400 [Ziziphus jujuba var. spinosa]|uniref:Uncharacterized protein n=1 Tax=Ziziphus jujuba var. spinosa TaxID=714518 RepID=A0A978V3J8_ZIZJJ|nr:hypothetical protein FEM48_Zijuj07G0084400 [Ziziphus jujuba var. spinosa]